MVAVKLNDRQMRELYGDWTPVSPRAPTLQKELRNPVIATTGTEAQTLKLYQSFTDLIKSIDKASDGKALMQCSVPMIEHFKVGNLYSDERIQNSMTEANEVMTKKIKQFGLQAVSFSIEDDVKDLVGKLKSGDDAELKRAISTQNQKLKDTFKENYQSKTTEDSFFNYVKNAALISNELNQGPSQESKTQVQASREQSPVITKMQEPVIPKETEESTPTEKEKGKGIVERFTSAVGTAWKAFWSSSDLSRTAIGLVSIAAGVILFPEGVALAAFGLVVVVPSVAHLAWVGARNEWNKEIQKEVQREVPEATKEAVKEVLKNSE
jgi:hypothetical protein